MPSQEEIEEQLKLLAVHRETLSILLEQQAKHTKAFTPPATAHGIREARDNIAGIKGVLRGWGVEVEDHPDDIEIPFQSKILNNTLTTYFSESAIKDFASQLEIDYEALKGDDDQAKSRELVLYCQKPWTYRCLKTTYRGCIEAV